MNSTPPSTGVTVPMPGVAESGQEVMGREARRASKVRRLGRAIAQLSQDLAAARSELEQLREENARLSRSLDQAKNAVRPERSRSRREKEILTMVRAEQRRNAGGRPHDSGSQRQSRPAAR